MRFSNAFKLFLINMIDLGIDYGKPHCYKDDFYYFKNHYYIGKNGNKIYTLEYDVYKSQDYNRELHDWNYINVGRLCW